MVPIDSSAVYHNALVVKHLLSLRSGYTTCLWIFNFKHRLRCHTKPSECHSFNLAKNLKNIPEIERKKRNQLFAARLVFVNPFPVSCWN